MCSEAFLLLDREYNGLINAGDLQLLCQSLKHDAVEYEGIIEEAEQSIRGPDVAARGFLDLNDFCIFMRGKDAAAPQKGIFSRFWRSK